MLYPPVWRIEAESDREASGLNIRGMVGGVIGGIDIIAVAAYLVWRFYIKPKRSSTSWEQDSPPSDDSNLPSGCYPWIPGEMCSGTTPFDSQSSLHPGPPISAAGTLYEHKVRHRRPRPAHPGQAARRHRRRLSPSRNGGLAILSELWKFNKQQYSRLASGERELSVFLWASTTTHSIDDMPLKHLDDFFFLPDLPFFYEVIDSEFQPLKEKLRKEVRDAGNTSAGPSSGLSASTILARFDEAMSESSAFNREIRLWDLHNTFFTSAGISDFAGGCAFDYDNLVFQLQALGLLTRDNRQQMLKSGILATYNGKPGPLYLDLVRALYSEAAGEEELQTNLAFGARHRRDPPRHQQVQVEQTRGRRRQTSQEIARPPVGPGPPTFENEVVATFAGRTLFRTGSGVLGLSCPGVEGVAVGDRVVLLEEGATFPVVLRSASLHGGDERIVGCAVVESVKNSTDGVEGAGLPARFEPELETFRIV
ncbi:hypothetical protein ACJZ2D_014777 [Fusarium nematophilum]